MIIALSAPMETMSASSEIGVVAAITAITAAPMIVIRCGVPNRGWAVPIGFGRSPSRPIANPIRPMVTSSTIITEVNPVTAPIEMSAPTHGRPTALKAPASGAPGSIRS